jgi:hypothetical protein
MRIYDNTRSSVERSSNRSSGPEVGESLQEMEFPTILVAPPSGDSFTTSATTRRTVATESRRSDIDNKLIDEFGVGVGNIDEFIREGLEADFANMNEKEILATLAATNINQLMLDNVMLDQFTAMATFLNDIAVAVEPFSNITVSGTNSISEPDAAEPVIPNSDEQEIKVRKLFMRSSPDNDEAIWVGDDNVNPENGFVLRKGESKTIHMDSREEVLYMASKDSGNEVQLLGVF